MLSCVHPLHPPLCATPLQGKGKDRCCDPCFNIAATMAESMPKVDLSRVVPLETEYTTASGGGGGSGVSSKDAKGAAFDFVLSKPDVARGSGSTVVSRHASRSVDADSATRAKLFGSGDRTRTATKSTATPASSTQRQADGLQGTKNVMSETLQILEANREKLSQTADKSEEMANQVRIAHSSRVCTLPSEPVTRDLRICSYAPPTHTTPITNTTN